MQENNFIQFIGVTPENLIDEIVSKLKVSLLNELEQRQQSNGDDYLSAQDICERFKITKTTVHEWRKRGILKPFKLGARVYYRLIDIENAMITDID